MDYITNFWNQYSGEVVNFGIALAFLLGFYIVARGCARACQESDA